MSSQKGRPPGETGGPRKAHDGGSREPSISAEVAPLYIPEIARDDDVASAALKYAKAGWYVLPIDPGTKKPAGELGKNWGTKSSRDPDQIVAWFSGSNYGVGLHVGRSGVAAFDVDHPDKLPEPLRRAIDEHAPPYQQTRPDTDRGHYLFRFRAGRVLGNGTGKLGGAWGEIRGRGGQIVVAPTPHADGGRYEWRRAGPVPELPAYVDELLNDAGHGADVATDAEVIAFLDRYRESSRPELLDAWVSTFRRKAAEGESRHDRMISVAAGAFKEARAGYYPARTAMERLEAAFLEAVTRDPVGPRQSAARSVTAGRHEWRGISAWAVAQAEAADPAAVRARVDERMPDGNDLSWVPEPAGDGQPPTATTPRQFIDKYEGLRAVALADAVTELGPIAEGDDGHIWEYRGGVWCHAKNVVRDRVTRLLGDLYRDSHARNAESIIRARGAKIRCEPIAEVINFRNGLYYWETGELKPHTPDVLSTVQLAANWDPEASCPAFNKFLSEVVPSDAADMVWELIGYLMYSGNPLHKAGMLTGSGRNGKGTFLRVVKALLGEQNTTAVSLHDLVNTRFRTAELFGKIANIAGDIDPRYMESTATFKAITGEDLIQAERKGRDPFDFTPWAVPLFSANKIPPSADVTTGYLSRWIVVPFPNSFVGRENRGLTGSLTTAGELNGIAAAAVPALRRLMERGDFDLPESAIAARGEFEKKVDQVRTWTADCADIAPVHPFVPRTRLYRSYKAWAARDGYRAVRASEFYDRVEAAGGEPVTVQGVRGFKGVRVIDEGIV